MTSRLTLLLRRARALLQRAWSRLPASRPKRAAVLAGLALALVALAAAGTWLTLPDVAPLAKTNPRTTALIEQRRREAAEDGRRFAPRQAWVPLNRIAPRLVQAVILSEDAKFFGHEGFDWEAIRDAAEKGLERGRFSRGGSTITQQLAKNLYLGTQRTLTRKGKEALLAVKLERDLSKRRILAIYLNVAEWGPGTFGVEAASRRWFGRSAAGLTTAQAAVLASMLPAPRKAALGPAPRWLARRSRKCLDRLRAAGRIDAAEHARARAELQAILSGEAGDDEEPPRDDDRREPARIARSGEAGGDARPAAWTPEDERAPEPPSAAPLPSAGAAP